MSRNNSKKNVSRTIKNGTLVTFRDSYLENGKNTKREGNDVRVGVVIDSNRDDKVAILKQQHSLNSISYNNRSFNPNIKTRNKNNELLSIDGNNVRLQTRVQNSISEKESNELKRKALKDTSKNVRKPNRRRLKELKNRQ